MFKLVCSHCFYLIFNLIVSLIFPGLLIPQPTLLQQPKRQIQQQLKLLPGIASLFKSSSTAREEYCFTELPKAPPPTCDSAICSQGCSSQRVVIADEIGSSGDDDSADSITSEASTNSSVEDTLDAFEDLPGNSGAGHQQPKRYKLERIRSSRQKGDAASLKRYAYGEICILYLFSCFRIRNLIKMICILYRFNVHGSRANCEVRLQRRVLVWERLPQES